MLVSVKAKKKKTKTKTKTKQKHLDLDQVERDFCSARQAYAQAQQEERSYRRKRPPTQFPRSVLSMNSLKGELLGEAH